MTIETAIKKAVKGGYKDGEAIRWSKGATIGGSLNDFFLDPLFWSCLGKAMGWQGEATRELFYCRVYKHPERDGDTSGGVVLEWQYHWHCFIDKLAEGKTAEDFFRELK